MPELPQTGSCSYCGEPTYRVLGSDLIYNVRDSRPHSCGPAASPTEEAAVRQADLYGAMLRNYRTHAPSFVLGDNIITNVTGPDEPDIPFEQEEPPMPTGTPESWWNANPLPDGFYWHQSPAPSTILQTEIGTFSLDAARVTGPEYAAKIAEVREWAASLGVRLSIARYYDLYVGNAAYRVPLRLRAAQADEDTFYSQYDRPQWSEPFVCPLCSEEHPAYTIMCAERVLACQRCSSAPYMHELTFREYAPDPTLIQLNPVGQGALLCSNCSQPCEHEGCDGWADSRSGDRYCNDHASHANCGVCGRRMEMQEDSEWFVAPNYGPVCSTCEELTCQECAAYSPAGLQFSDYYDLNVCRSCHRRGMVGDGTEEYDSAASMTNRTLRLPTIPGRENIRRCGVEIEGANGTEGGNELALALYEAGISNTDNRTGYHHGSGAGFAHVENDSTVDWECVIGPINMAEREDVRRLGRAIRLIRERVRDGRLSLDLRAGCHIHVDAARVSLDGAFNLATLFAYVEDVIFRLGAAKWPIHRALQGSDYAQPIPKETRKLAFARANGDEDGSRYYALSFNNYFSQMLGGCRCGATRYDSWEDCTCNLGKCTFEFRVFNTTANPRKLHAYLALSQALVAKALSLGKLDDPANEFPVHGFVHKRFKDMTDAEQGEIIEEWQERLEWIFDELPLTDYERESIAYCVRNSELAHAGEDFINELTGAVSEREVEEVAA